MWGAILASHHVVHYIDNVLLQSHMTFESATDFLPYIYSIKSSRFRCIETIRERIIEAPVAYMFPYDSKAYLQLPYQPLSQLSMGKEEPTLLVDNGYCQRYFAATLLCAGELCSRIRMSAF